MSSFPKLFFPGQCVTTRRERNRQRFFDDGSQLFKAFTCKQTDEVNFFILHVDTSTNVDIVVLYADDVL